MGERGIGGKPTDGPISRYINRKLSNPITKFIVRHNIDVTPNQMSILSAFIGMLSLPLYILNNPVLAGILVQVSSVLDGVDGELARARNMVSRRGRFLDACLDRYTDFIILAGASLYTLQKYGGIITYLSILLALAGSILVSYIHARGEKDLGIHPATIGVFPNIASRDVRLFIIFLGSIIDQLLYTLLILGVITNIYFIVKILETYGEAKDM